MKTYLLKIFNAPTEKKHFITDIIEADSCGEAMDKVFGKKYYFDSERKNILGICRKSEVVNEII